jgi:hypothetical protein
MQGFNINPEIQDSNKNDMVAKKFYFMLPVFMY